jgi:hypothetical protein
MFASLRAIACAFVAGLTLSSCGSDSGGEKNCQDANNDGACDVGSLVGEVVDVGGSPLGHVRVEAGGTVTVTDDGGHFVLADLAIPVGPAVATFKLGGYGTLARRVELRVDDMVYTRAVLKAANVQASGQDPTAAFTVADPSAVRVTFPAGSLLDEGGTPIVDPVDVEIVSGDPTDPMEALLMPGDYLSDENGGTPLDSVAFLNVTVRAMTGAEVRRIDPDAPVVVELPIPATLQADYTAGNTIPWWSFDESTGYWRREGTATVFDDGGTLWTRAEATHLSWWNVDNPVDEHGCVCVDIVGGTGAPIAGAQVVARGVTYTGTSTPVYADGSGRACVTVKNSATSPEQVDVLVHAGGVDLPFANNPIDTPTAVASCLRNVDCPDKCDVLSPAIVFNALGSVHGTVTLPGGAPATDLLVFNFFGAYTKTDTAGFYSLPVILDEPFEVLMDGYTSPGLVATVASPEVVHDIALTNQAPELTDFSVNGIPQALETNRRVHAKVPDTAAAVEFVASAIDGDGDPITYTWSGSCYLTFASHVVIDCAPPDAPTTTCDPPDQEGPPGCQYRLFLDDGHVPEPVEWLIVLDQGP